MGVEFGREAALVAHSEGHEYRVPLGLGDWRSGGTLPMGRVRHMNDPAYRAGASGAWTDDDTFTAQVCFYETPFCLTLGLRFAGDALVLDREMNVGFGPTRRPTLVGLPRRATRAAAEAGS